MGTKQAFKTYTRGQRIQDTNISFAKGMYFSDAPLIEGFSRLLVNFDIDSDTGSLKPRKGFQTLPDGYVAAGDLEEATPSKDNDYDGMTLDSASQIIYNGETYYHIIVGQRIPTGENIENEPRGNAWVLTVTKNGASNYSITACVPLNENLCPV